MTRPEPHRIQRQVLEVEFAGGAPDVASQERLAREVHDQFIPAMSDAFDEVSGPHDWLRLDRLTLELGTVSADDWAPRLRERLVEQIRRELGPHALARRSDVVRSAAPESPSRPPSSTPTSATARGATARTVEEVFARTQAQPGRLMEQLRFFLARGRLPWWGDRLADGFAAAFADAPGGLDWPALRASVRADAVARGRLVDVLADAQLEAGIAAWRATPHAAQVFAAWAPPASTPAGRLAWRHGFWQAVIAWALADVSGAASGPELVRALRRQWLALAAPDASSEAAAPPIGAGHAPPRGTTAASWPAPWNSWWQAATQGAADVVDDTGQGTEAAPVAVRHPTPARAPLALVSPRASGEDESAAVYLPGAGVVLLHPFLETLLRDRGLLAGAVFRDDAARARAVRLVGRLAFGAAEAPEYDLPIAKLLCGHPLDAPLPPDALDDADVRACDELLAAVLGHWTALRSSSAAWLRSQFFLRDGKLETVDFGCRLTIERRAQDVLLLRLPWGFGVIGLPWMAEKIFVRWLD